MTRPTCVHIDQTALLYNLRQVKRYAPGKKVIAMVKANAYGCGLSTVAPVLEKEVDAFGVACIEEALAIRKLGVQRDCVLLQGVFSADELLLAAKNKFQPVIHSTFQLQSLVEIPLENTIKIWVKVNTGMNRLGFLPQDIYDVLQVFHSCPWVDENIGLMTHLACADSPENPANYNQLEVFKELNLPSFPLIKSIANSGAIMALPDTHADVVRPGIMLYGVSPFPQQTGLQLGLMPVMHFVSAISAIYHYPAGVSIGYGGAWKTSRASIIGIVTAGYGDGYPRHVGDNTPVWINGNYAPIVGRVSMDMLTVDLTDCSGVEVGSPVELWGQYVPVETVAEAAGTIGYELLCQFVPRIQ